MIPNYVGFCFNIDLINLSPYYYYDNGGDLVVQVLNCSTCTIASPVCFPRSHVLLVSYPIMIGDTNVVDESVVGIFDETDVVVGVSSNTSYAFALRCTAFMKLITCQGHVEDAIHPRACHAQRHDSRRGLDRPQHDLQLYVRSIRALLCRFLLF